jgi:hypothetical protein
MERLLKQRKKSLLPLSNLLFENPLMPVWIFQTGIFMALSQG